jgi:drug/metabolite transporter (DMT)-like permease
MKGKTRRFALLEGVAAGTLFGTASVFIRLVEVNMFSIAIWRLMIASATLAIIILVFSKRPSARLLRGNIVHFLVLGLLLGTHFMLFISAVKHTTIMNASVLVNTTPIFSMLVSTFLYRVKPSKLALGGIITSFIGAGLIAYGDAGPGGRANLVGDLEATLAAVAEGFYLNYGGKRRGQLAPVSTMLFVYLASAMTVGTTAFLAQAPIEMAGSIQTLLPLIGLGILPTAVAHTLYFSSLSNLKSFETATMALLEPLGATLLGIAVFAELPAPIFIAGAILVLTGIVSIARGK